jgi:hypothetical protein
LWGFPFPLFLSVLYQFPFRTGRISGTGYPRRRKKSEPKLARYTDQVAGFHSPQSEVSALVRKMFVSDNDVLRNILFFLLEVVLE